MAGMIKGSTASDLRKDLEKLSHATRENAKLCGSATTKFRVYLAEHGGGDLARSQEFLSLLESFLQRTFGGAHSAFYLQNSAWIVAAARGGDWRGASGYRTVGTTTSEAEALLQLLLMDLLPLMQRWYLLLYAGAAGAHTSPQPQRLAGNSIGGPRGARSSPSSLSSPPSLTLAAALGASFSSSASASSSSPSSSLSPAGRTLDGKPVDAGTLLGMGLEELPKRSALVIGSWRDFPAAERGRWLAAGSALPHNATRLYGLDSRSDEVLLPGRGLLRGRLHQASSSLDCDPLSYFLTTVVAHAVRPNRKGQFRAGNGNNRRERQRHMDDVQAGGALDPWNTFTSSGFGGGGFSSFGLDTSAPCPSAGLVHRLVVRSNDAYNALLGDLAKALVVGAAHGRRGRRVASGSGDFDDGDYFDGGDGNDADYFDDDYFDDDGGGGGHRMVRLQPAVCELLVRLVVEQWLTRSVVIGCGGRETHARESHRRGLQRYHRHLLSQQQQQQQQRYHHQPPYSGDGGGGGGGSFFGGPPSSLAASAAAAAAAAAEEALPSELLAVLKDFSPPTLRQVNGLLIFSARLLADPDLLSHVDVTCSDNHSGGGGGSGNRGGRGGGGGGGGVNDDDAHEEEDQESDEDYGYFGRNASAHISPSHHPVAIMREEVAGFLASCFQFLRPAHGLAALRQTEDTGAGNPTATFVRLVELWVLWMQPWTAPRLLHRRGYGSGMGSGWGGGGGGGGGYSGGVAVDDAWQAWVLAVEDIYVLPLVPFLSAMGSAHFDGTRREAQLCSIETVLRCFTAGSHRFLRRRQQQQQQHRNNRHHRGESEGSTNAGSGDGGGDSGSSSGSSSGGGGGGGGGSGICPPVMRALLSSPSGLARRVLVMPEQLRQLVAMGYAEDAARTALERAWYSSAAFPFARSAPQQSSSSSSSSSSEQADLTLMDVPQRNLERALMELDRLEDEESGNHGDGNSGSAMLGLGPGDARENAWAEAVWRDEIPDWRSRGTEVFDFLHAAHHAVLFGSWLPQNLDYGDVTNRLLWVLVMACAQAAQVLELLVSGTSARWRLNRVSADLSIIFGVNQTYFKQAFGSQGATGGATHSRDPFQHDSGGGEEAEALRLSSLAASSSSWSSSSSSSFSVSSSIGDGRRRFGGDGRGGGRRGRRDDDPWARPLQSYELKPLVLLCRWGSRRLDRFLEAAWNSWAARNHNKHKNSSQNSSTSTNPMSRRRQQQEAQLATGGGGGGGGGGGTPRPRWLGGHGAPINLRPAADMRNVGFALLICAIARSPPLRAAVTSAPCVVLMVTYTYFLRYPDKWYHLVNTYSDMFARGEWW